MYKGFLGKPCVLDSFSDFRGLYGQTVLLGLNYGEKIFNDIHNIFSTLCQSNPDFMVTGREIISCGKVHIAKYVPPAYCKEQSPNH